MAERSAKQLGLSQADLPNSVLEVIATLSKSGFEAYLVGGGVRDTLLGLNPKDFDAVTSAKPHEVKDIFGKRCRIIGRRFQLAHVYSGRDMIEVATFRAPPKGNSHTTSDGMIVRDNVWGDIKQDFARRDFTINSLYYQPIKGVVHDFCNALDDIKLKTLRLLGDAPVRIEEDPVRLLRALRFKAKLSFDFDPALEQQFHDDNWSLLEQVSPHRLYDESQKMFTGGYLVPLLPLLFDYGAIKHLIIYPPKAPSALVKQVAINTDKRIGMGKSINPAFFYAALLWDNYLYQLAKFKKKGLPFQDAQFQAASTVIGRQRIKTAIPKFAEQFIRDIWLLQPKLANPKAKQIAQLADHPRFRAAYDFLLLREQCDDVANPLSESTNGMGAWWQNYQELPIKQKQQAVADLDSEGRRGGSKRGRQRNRNNNADNVNSGTDNTDSDTDVSSTHHQESDSFQKSEGKTKSNANSNNKQSTANSSNDDKDSKINSAKVPAKRSRKKAMSRPQKAHLARERDQLLKLSLNPLDDEQGEDNSQPAPLFTISADKLAKQLPQQLALEESQTLQASNEDNLDVKNDDSKSNKSTDVDAGSVDDKASSTPSNVLLPAKSGSVPSKRKRRAPSSTITQIERLKLNSSEQQSSVQQNSEGSQTLNAAADNNTPPTKPSKQIDNKPTKNKKSQPKSERQDVKVGASPNPSSSSSSTGSSTVSKQRVDSSNGEVVLITKSEPVPSMRRRRAPSSQQTVRERQMAN